MDLENVFMYSALSLHRRAAQLSPYKLRCDREPLSSRLGPPDFYPPTPNCAEEILNRDFCVNGYKEAIDGVEETSEARLSLVTTHNLWTRQSISKYREAIRKRHRALNNSLIRKRKAGQIYGIPLSGSLLSKPGVFPEQRTCGEEFKKKWIEDLSQHKRLRSLAEHVPHGYRRRTLFEALVKYNVPLLRATWFIKITYLNQVRPLSIGISAGGPEKSQAKRVEIWTKDVLEFAQCLLDDLCQQDLVPSGVRQPSSVLGIGSDQQGGDSSQRSPDGGEQDLQTKWRYIMRLIYWHYEEGLVHRPQLVDWVFKNLQEKELVEALQLLLPLVFKLINGILLSQTHIRLLVEISLRWLQELWPAGDRPTSVGGPHVMTVAITLTELLRFLLVIVPDCFVGMDCFPLPHCFIPREEREGHVSAGTAGGTGKVSLGVNETCKLVCYDSEARISSMERACHQTDVIMDEVEAIQRRSASLCKAVNPGLLRNNEGKVVQGLDKALLLGDVQCAYQCVFDEDIRSTDLLRGESQAEAIFAFRSTIRLLKNLSSSKLFGVCFLCEWAVCDFRDNRQFSGSAKSISVRDISRVYMAVSVLRFLAGELSMNGPDASNCKAETMGNDMLNSDISDAKGLQVKKRKNKDINHSNVHAGRSGQRYPTFFPCEQPVHDLIVAWLDQHELRKDSSSELLQFLMFELIQEGIFKPDVYVRQLICSGILEMKGTAEDATRASRHKRLLQYLPEPMSFDGTKDRHMLELARLYHNERNLALESLNCFRVKRVEWNTVRGSHPRAQDEAGGMLDSVATVCSEQRFSVGKMENDRMSLKKNSRKKMKLVELKQAISTCFRFPAWCIALGGVMKEASHCYNLQPHALERGEATPGCEECSRSKRLKTNEGKSWTGVAISSLTEEEEQWWCQKLPFAVKHELPAKAPVKQSTRGRPKTVRRTQSLAQLATARTEGSHGASTSQMSDVKVNCPVHRRIPDVGSNSQARERSRVPDIHAVGILLASASVSCKRAIANWLDICVRNLVMGGERIPSSKNNGTVAPQCSKDGRSAVVQWRMNEEQLAMVAYLFDVANDYRRLVKLLLWLLPASSLSPAISSGHGNRSMPTVAFRKEGSTCEASEAAILSCLRRYEGVLAAMDLIPQALSAGMERAANLMAVVPGGRAGCSSVLCYVKDILRKYGSLSSIQAWEKNWKTVCDKRLGAELEALKAGDSEVGLGMVGLSGPGDERDDAIPPRLSGRLGRVGATLKDLFQRGMNEAALVIINKERDFAATGNFKDEVTDTWEEGQQVANRVVSSLMDAIRQNGGGAAQADSALVAAAVGTIVANAGTATANVFESLGTSNSSMEADVPLVSPGIRCGRRVLHIHMLCLRLLKEALGERHSRMLEVALANEANSVVVNAFCHPPGRAPRTPFHLSPETLDVNSNLSNDQGGVSNLQGRANTAAVAVASLVAGLIVLGVTTLERMVTVMKIREGLEALQISKTCMQLSNNISRQASVSGNLKDHVAEAHMYWFRVLIGDSRTVAGGLVANLLGESFVLGLNRLQRSMPLTTAFPPAYALFGAVLRKQIPLHGSNASREDSLLQSAIIAVNEVVAHEPFRDVCLRDTRALYLMLSSDTGESEYATMLDMRGLDVFSKMIALVPLRARLFLRALLDLGIPASLIQEEESVGQSNEDGRNRFSNEPGQTEQLVQVLDDLQPATYHWQWVELRLLLNEQVLIEKLEVQNMSAVDAVQAAAAGSQAGQLCECEKTFTEVVLTRLLVRPDAAALYSEAVHSLGRALEEYLILQVKWVLEGSDMLLGRKSLQQLLDNYALRQGFSISMRRVSACGWQPPQKVHTSLSGKTANKPSPEEGELPDVGRDWRLKKERKTRVSSFPAESESSSLSNQFTTEKALADLVLPCLARSSNDTRSGFAVELIKQLSNLEQQITLLSCLTGKAGAAGVGEGMVGKATGGRKGARSVLEGGSPGLGRKLIPLVTESSTVSAGALQASMWLRLQFLMPLLLIIQTDREQSGRNMRQTLAPILLRLLGTRVVQEAMEPIHAMCSDNLDKNCEVSSAMFTGVAGECLFERLLSVLHSLLSNTWAVWLKPRSTMKGSLKPLREVPFFDREAAERLQGELEHIVPWSVRARLQSAMPLLPVSSANIVAGSYQTAPSLLSVMCSVSLHLLPPSVGQLGTSQKFSSPLESNLGKGKLGVVCEPEVEVDPWLLLEDAVGLNGSGGSGGLSGEAGSTKACSWLKGSVRVRRSDLTYVGTVDEDT